MTSSFQSRIQSSVGDEIDVICMDVPLFTRMLELAREDIKTDADLHRVLTKVIRLSKLTTRLTMDDYPAIVEE